MQNCVQKTMKNKLFFENCLLYNYILKKEIVIRLREMDKIAPFLFCIFYHIYIFSFHEKKTTKDFKKKKLLQHQKTTSYSKPRKKKSWCNSASRKSGSHSSVVAFIKGCHGKGSTLCTGMMGLPKIWAVPPIAWGKE